MPIFEYSCKDCGKQFEAFVTADRSPSCPGCQSDKLAKRLSSPGMVGAGASSRASSSALPAGSCGAGGDSCACRMN